MSDNALDLLRKLQPASRGSKTGWVSVTGQVPPELDEELTKLEATGLKRTDMVHEGLALFIESKRAA